MAGVEDIQVEIKHMQQQIRFFLQKHWKLFLTEGILFTVLGICAMLIPHFFTVAIVIFLGWLMLFGGAVHLARALLFANMPGFGLWLFMGVLQLLAGYLFVTKPAVGILTVTMLMALFFILEGLTKLTLAFLMRPLAHWGFLLFSGATALFFGLIIALSWVETADWLLGLFLGINMIFLGISLIKISLHHRGGY